MMRSSAQIQAGAGTGLVVNRDATGYDASLETQIVGRYGDFFVQADGTWRYVKTDATDSAPEGEVTETLQIRVQDTRSEWSAPLPITVMIQGENDTPTLQMNAAAGTDPDLGRHG